MHLGSRSIRSAGARSGSVEVTLPPDLRALAGVRCDILLRDGHRPEIVLTPDLRPAVATLGRLWTRLVTALACGEGAGELPLGDLIFVLCPQERAAGERIHDLRAGHPLAWIDALLLAGSTEAPADALARCLAPLASICAGRLGIAPSFEAEWGAGVAFAATGTVIAPAWREVCDLTGAVLARAGHRPGEAFARSGSLAASERFWSDLAAPLGLLAETFQGFTRDPALREQVRAAWRRGLYLELSGG